MSHQNADRIDLISFLSMVRRQRRVAVAASLAVFACAFLFLVRTPPQYSAEALIRIAPQGNSLLEPAANGTVSAAAETALIGTEVEILKSSRLALQTIAREDLFLGDAFGPRPGWAGKLRAALGLDLPELPSAELLAARTLLRFTDALEVRRRGQTRLVAVRVTTSDPVFSARVANAHARAYLEAQVADRVSAAISARDVLQSQLVQARGHLVASNGALQGYIGGRLDRLAEETGSETLAVLSGRLQAATGRLEEGADRLAAARLAAQKGGWDTLARDIGDGALLSLVRQRQQLLDQVSGGSGGQAAAVNLTEGLAALDLQIKARGETALDGLQEELSQVQELRGDLMNTIRGEVLQSDLTPATVADLYTLQQEALAAQRQYDRLISRLRDIETQAVVEVASGRIVSEAIVPVSAAFPDARIVLALACLAAIGVSAGAVLAREFYFGGVSDGAQLGHVIPVKAAAAVPRQHKQAGHISVADLAVSDPLSPFAEACQKLSAAIDQAVAAPDGMGQVVLVTSALPAEGKSVTALSLARAYARAGKTTLLIDASLRNPALHQLLDETPKAGLVDFLMQGTVPVPMEAIYTLDPLSTLGCILGRSAEQVPAGSALQGKAFRELVSDAQALFDVVVIDSAALLPDADAQYMAPLADAVLLCVRCGAAGQGELREAHAALTGAVLPGTQILAALTFCWPAPQASARWED